MFVWYAAFFTFHFFFFFIQDLGGRADDVGKKKVWIQRCSGILKRHRG